MTRTISNTDFAQSLRTIIDEVSSIFLERRASIEADVLAILAKQHRFTLGPPGTGKSDQKREVISRIEGVRYFEALLSKTRPAEAVLGPYNLVEMRDHGDLHRKTNGFLPTADFAFLDEIGKMSPTLGHDLLSILNERIYHEVNGNRSAVPVPLRSAFTASNEMPVEESDDSAAIWDRLHVRDYVDTLQEPGNFVALLNSAIASNDPRNSTRTTVQFTDLADVIDNVVPDITVPTDAFQTVVQLRDLLRSKEIVPSDRRWRQCIRLLQASAFLNGRSQVEDDDVHVLRFALWDVPTQIREVERATLQLSNPLAEELLNLDDDLMALSGEIAKRKGESLEKRASFGTEANSKHKQIVSKLSDLRQKSLADGRSTTKLDEVADRAAAVKQSILTDCLDMDLSAF